MAALFFANAGGSSTMVSNRSPSRSRPRSSSNTFPDSRVDRRAVASGVLLRAADGILRYVERDDLPTFRRERQRKTAVIREAVQQPATRVLSRGGAILALIEEQTRLLAVPEVDVVSHAIFDHLDGLGNVACENLNSLRETLERPRPRIVAREDPFGLQ